ncbi:MAG: molybdopterin molybdotransferase MoeA [Magnetococcales bacterium]|nr:molybdopterin molybdotransferase MoeA [Magnetococcales bacterium]
MISFFEAQKRILANITPIQEREAVSPIFGLGRVLSHPAHAPANVPNHDNSAMDGYGVRFSDLYSDQTTKLHVIAELPAGEIITTPLLSGQAIRIMTGAPIPSGCDCVVMQEVVIKKGKHILVPSGQRQYQHIRKAGEDIQVGSEVLPAGRRLKPADLGLLTSLGISELSVFRRPVVALISSGNEVVEPGQPLKPGYVYDSNRTTLNSTLKALGVEVLDLGVVRDSRPEVERILHRGGEEADVIISTGGVSVGDYDLIKDVLKQWGNINFWKVAMKPGKPQAYGKLGKALFFGLPGNPVSSLTVFLTMVRPALIRLMGANDEQPQLLTMKFRGTINKRNNRMNFVRGIVHYDAEGPWVETTGSQGSGILTSLSKANAFIVLPEEQLSINDGDMVTVQLIQYS